jgi:hypothetical protein
MSGSDFTDPSIDDLVAIYAEAAAAHARASGHGEHEVANRQHDILAATYRRLRERGSRAQTALLALLDHSDPGVRGWAGAHALEFSPEQGEATLSELVTRGGLQGLNAEMTLETWRQGNLRFP